MTPDNLNPEAGPTSLRILIADDIEAVRHSTRLMLKLLPHVDIVAVARDGQEAVELAWHYKPDVVIIDINMPRLDGLSAVKAMRQQRPELICIVISTERDDQTLKQAKDNGAADFLIKPFTVEELLEAVGRAGDLLKSRRGDRANGQVVPPRGKQTGQLRDQRHVHLLQLAATYAKARRTDEEAMRVYEELAEHPYCEHHWLKSLATIYLIHDHWGKLKALAERLELQTQTV